MKPANKLLPYLSLLFGVAGLVLRFWQLTTCFDENNLPVSGPAFPILIACSAAAAVYAVLSTRTLKTPSDWTHAVGEDSCPPLVLSAVCSGVAGVWFVLSYTPSSRMLSTFAYAEYTLPALMVLGCAMLTAGLFLLSRSGQKASIPVMLCGYASCFWILNAYRTHASNPVVPQFAWFLLAVVFSAVAWCRLAAFTLNRGKASAALRACFLAISFSITSLAGSEASYDLLLLFAHILSLFLLSRRLLAHAQ